jgi:uncharacterized membrane protein
MHIQESEYQPGEQLATALGWFSVALGATELIAPRSLARAIGVPDASISTIRAFGARELASGLGLLTRSDSSGWVWSRVGGDAIDISYLASAMNSSGTNRTRVATALAAVLGLTALDVLCARQLSDANGGAIDWRRPEALYSHGRDRLRRHSTVHVEEVVTINKPVDEVYRAWKNFESFPRFMKHLESVKSLGGGRSRWRATAPAGATVEWDAEIVQDIEGNVIAWRSVEGSQIQNSGTVHFRPAPGVRGSEVRVRLDYRPPAGRVGRGVAWLFGEEPEQQLRDDLRRFKQLLETGEIPVSDGIGLWRPAQPPQSVEEGRTLAGVRS